MYSWRRGLRTFVESRRGPHSSATHGRRWHWRHGDCLPYVEYGNSNSAIDALAHLAPIPGSRRRSRAHQGTFALSNAGSSMKRMQIDFASLSQQCWLCIQQSEYNLIAAAASVGVCFAPPFFANPLVGGACFPLLLGKRITPRHPSRQPTTSYTPASTRHSPIAVVTLFTLHIRETTSQAPFLAHQCHPT